MSDNAFKSMVESLQRENPIFQQVYDFNASKMPIGEALVGVSKIKIVNMVTEITKDPLDSYMATQLAFEYAARDMSEFYNKSIDYSHTIIGNTNGSLDVDFKINNGWAYKVSFTPFTYQGYLRAMKINYLPTHITPSEAIPITIAVCDFAANRLKMQIAKLNDE
jgi:hypothetical protein